MRYDDQGQRIGWVRYYQGRMLRFDNQGRALDLNDQPMAVKYRNSRRASGLWTRRSRENSGCFRQALGHYGPLENLA